MKRSGWMAVAVASLALTETVLAASGALKVGTPVYVKSRNTRLLSAADVTGAVSATLQPGDVVEWQKKENAQFHQVLVPSTKKTGFVFFANLSTRKPAPEYLRRGGDAAVDTKAFATSGAATKALAEGPISYGEKKLNSKAAVNQVIGLENIARSINAGELQTFAQARGLYVPVVSAPVAAVQEGAK